MPRASASRGLAANMGRASRPANSWPPMGSRWIPKATSMSARSASPTGRPVFPIRRCRNKFAPAAACRSWRKSSALFDSVVAAFETHRVAMLLRMRSSDLARSQPLMVRSASSRVPNREAVKLPRANRILLRLDVRGLDDRPPALALGFLEIPQRLGRLLIDRRDLDAKFRKTLPDSRIEQHLRHRGVELGDDVFRRALRHPEPVPQRGKEAGQPRFIRGRNVRRGSKPRMPRNRKRLDATGRDQSLEVRGRLDHEVDLLGQQILHRRSIAAIGNELELGAGGLPKRNPGEMAGGADARDADRRLVGIGLEPGDQALQIVCRQALLADDQQRLAANFDDRLEVLQQIEWQMIEAAGQHMRGGGADAERVAVGERANRAADADA